jgi:hypothetical protein
MGMYLHTIWVERHGFPNRYPQTKTDCENSTPEYLKMSRKGNRMRLANWNFYWPCPRRVRTLKIWPKSSKDLRGRS